MKRFSALFGILALALMSAPAFAATNVTMCAAPGTAPNQVQTFTNGTLTPDANGCVVVNTAIDPLGKDMLTLLRAGWTQGVVPTESITSNGHLLSLKGSGTLPTVGTGTVTAGGTDNAMEVTGGTSPVTVTFTGPLAFANKPICTCTDETAALGACKVVPTATTAVVTTTGTDSFMLLCVGK